MNEIDDDQDKVIALDGVSYSDVNGEKKFKPDSTAIMASRMKDFSGRNNISDMFALDAQALILDQYIQNFTNKNISRANILEIQQKIDHALSAASKEKSQNDIEKEIVQPDITQPSNIGYLLLQKRVINDLLNEIDTSKSNVDQSIQKLQENYRLHRYSVAGIKASKARKLIEESENFGSDVSMEDLSEAQAALATMRLAESVNSILEIDSAEKARKSYAILIAQKLTKKTTSPASQLEIKIIIDYAIARGYIKKQDIEGIPNANSFLEEFDGGKAVKSIKINLQQGETIAPESLSEAKEVNSFYHPSIEFFGDAHGFYDQPSPGALGVNLGDLLDIKPSMYKNNTEYRQRVDKYFQQHLDEKMTAIENGTEIFVIGNHDMSLPLIFRGYMQYQEKFEEGKIQEANLLTQVTADALNHWLNEAGGKEVCMVLKIPLTGEKGQDIITILQNERLRRFAKLVIEKGKLYAIANERFCGHTIPAADKNGNLLEMEDGQSGLKALKILQLKLRQGDFTTIVRLHDTEWTVQRNGKDTGTTYEHGPLWRRENDTSVFYLPADPKDQTNYSHLNRLIANLSLQAEEIDDTKIDGLNVGHTSGEGLSDPEARLVNIDHAQNAKRSAVKIASSKAIGNSATFSHERSNKTQSLKNTLMKKSVRN